LKVKGYYLANAPVITSSGLYKCEMVSPEEISKFCKEHAFLGASVRHRSTGLVLSQLTGIPSHRIINGGFIEPKPGEAVVFARPKPGVKRRGVDQEMDIHDLEFGILYYLEVDDDS